jgi:GT2 family glycosyltransferase
MPGATDLALSVIVPVRDGAAYLPALLDGFARQTLPRARFEVIIVDNASRDETAAIARRWGATVVQEPVPNRAGARNRGVEAAHTDLFAFTDADCVASERWLEALVGCARQAAMTAGPVIVSTNPEPNAVERFESLWRFGQEHWVKEGWAATANLCVRREVFDAVGGFDGTYRHIGEDVDFCVRAARLGHRVGWCREAAVSHDAEHRLWPMLKRSFFHGYSVNQAHYRLGGGYRAWRQPWLAVRGERALTQLGATRAAFPAREWRRMLRLARASYGARVLGSIYAELRRAR